MIGDSTENLWGGQNALIMEAMKKVASASDVQVPEGKKVQLDDSVIFPPVDYDHLKESEDYHCIKGVEAWKKKVKDASLNTEDNKNKIDATDSEGNLQGWYNKSTDMGYIHKDMKTETLNEGASHLQMLYAIQNAIDKTERGEGHYADNIHSEMSRCGMNPHSQEDHQKLNDYVKDLTNGGAHTHYAYAAKKTSGKLQECKADQILAEAQDLEESLTDAQKEKMEDIVLKLKKSSADFKERYGDDWESVLYATATKMAKAK